MRRWISLPEILDLPGLEVVLAQGPLRDEPGWRWFSDEEPFAAPETAAQIGARGRSVEELVRSLGRDAGSVVVGGFSQGGVVALEVALRSELPFAGILCISGHPPPDGPFSSLAPGRSILCTHGDADERLPFETAGEAYARLVHQGIPIALERYSKGHGLDPCEERRSIRRWLVHRLPGIDEASQGLT